MIKARSALGAITVNFKSGLKFILVLAATVCYGFAFAQSSSAQHNTTAKKQLKKKVSIKKLSPTTSLKTASKKQVVSRKAIPSQARTANKPQQQNLRQQMGYRGTSLNPKLPPPPAQPEFQPAPLNYAKQPVSTEMAAATSTQTSVVRNNPADQSISFAAPEVNLSYRVRTNLADQMEPRIYTHGFGLDLSTQSKKITTYTLSAGLGYRYRTIDKDIDDQAKSQDLEDIDVGASISRPINQKWSWSVGIGSNFPLSQESQYEGYRAVPSVSAGLNCDVSSWYSVSQSLSAGYIVNEYEYSPSRGSGGGGSYTINSDYYQTYTLVQTFKFAKRFSTSLSLGAKNTHYLDGSNDSGLNYNSTFGINANFKPFTASLSYSAGGYTNPRTDEFWYVDEGRRILALGIGYGF